MTLVFRMDEFVAQWVAQRVKGFSPNPGQYVAIGIADGQRLIAGAVYHDYTRNGIGMTLAADSPRWATKGNIAALLRYPFEQLNVRRITVSAERKNSRSRKLIEGVGFKLEGVLREGFGAGKDAILYGMLKKDAVRWLERKYDGQIQLAARSA